MPVSIPFQQLFKDAGMDCYKLRESKGLTQAQFWPRIGITQSGGSRYENGDRPIPSPIEILLNVAYGSLPTARRIVANLRNGK